MPNQTMRMVARPRKMSSPVASNVALCGGEQLGDGLSKQRNDVLPHQLLPLMLREMVCMESLTPLFTFCMVVGKFCWK